MVPVAEISNNVLNAICCFRSGGEDGGLEVGGEGKIESQFR